MMPSTGAASYIPPVDPGSSMCSKVQLFISCRNLKDVDFVGVSDPLCNLYMRENPAGAWQKVGSTEIMKDNLNPDFEKSFTVNFYFEKHQHVKFEVLDGNNASGAYDMIGFAETTLGAMVGAKQQTFTSDLLTASSQKSRGKIIVRCDSVKESNMDIMMRVSARGLPSNVQFGCCVENNIFFEIYRGSATGDQFFKVYDSDPIAANVNPSYAPLKLTG